MLEQSKEFLSNSLSQYTQSDRYFIQKATDTNQTTIYAVYLKSFDQEQPEILGYIERYKAYSGYRYHASRSDDGHIFASKLKIALDFIKDGQDAADQKYLV